MADIRVDVPLDPESHRRARVAAAKAGLSLRKWVAALVERAVGKETK